MSAEVLAQLAFFQGLSRDALELFARDSEIRTYQANEHIVHQHDRALAVFFLLSGTVQFLIRAEGVNDLLVGVTQEPGALIGLSVFRAPHRYTASVRCEVTTRVLRVPRDAFTELFERDPACGVQVLRRVASAMAVRLEQARERLLSTSRDTPERKFSGLPSVGAPPEKPIPWRNERVVEFLHHSPFFEGVSDADLTDLADAASFVAFAQGETLFAQGALADA